MVIILVICMMRSAKKAEVEYKINSKPHRVIEGAVNRFVIVL